MKFPALATVIFFCIWLHFTLNRVSNADLKKRKSFWDRERQSNNVRKKSLDDLDYITIPLSDLPFGLLPDADSVIDSENIVKELSKEKIVNLTGLTNTDLKLMYGTANITPLSSYDQNYTSLVTALNKWGKELYIYGRYPEACRILEFAVNTKTDVTETYKLLCEMYQTKMELSSLDAEEKIKNLLPIASSLRSLSKDRIIDVISSYVDTDEISSPG